MAINVGSDVTDPTHHISLADSTGITIGLKLGRSQYEDQELSIRPDPTLFTPSHINRTVMKIETGSNKYADLEAPYASIAQDDWRGGRGQLKFEDNATLFFDSDKVDTTGIGILPAPLPTLAKSYIIDNVNGTSDTDIHCVDGNVYLSKYTTGSALIVTGIRFKLKSVTGTHPTQPLLITGYIFSDNAGEPGSLLAQANGYVDTDGNSIIPVSYTLSSSTSYWIGFQYGQVPGTGWNIKAITSVGNNIISHLGTISFEDKILWFSLIANKLYTAKSFIYKKAVFFVTNYDDDSAPSIYMNGLFGMAKDNATDKSKLNTGLNLSGKDLTGSVVYILSGPGKNEIHPYRKILSNTTTGTNDVITVDTNWKITHTTTTEFVIINNNLFTEVTGHGLTHSVTSVLVVDDIIYFAQGADNYLYRMRWNNGSWAASQDSDKGDFLSLVPKSTGGMQIWKAVASTCMVSNADIQAWGTNLTFTSSNNGKACGSTGYKITGLVSYGEYPIPYILKEGSVGGIQDGVYSEAPLDEMKNVASENNGRTSLTFGPYLFFSLLDGLERYYNGDMTDMGPNKNEGMPYSRRGNIVAMSGYPNRFYAAIDGGYTGFSSILCYNNLGWHELFRGLPGSQITSLSAQIIPGDTVDRLWFTCGPSMYWMPLSINPRNDENMTYNTGGQVISSWIYAGRENTKKAWTGITLFTEKADANNKILVEYRVDNDTDWTSAGTINTSPVQELDLKSADVTGYRFQYRVTMTNTSTTALWVKAISIECMEYVPDKLSYTLQFIVEDEIEDLEGDDDSYSTAESIYNVLDGWKKGANILTMRTIYSLHDNKMVWIASLETKPVMINTSAPKESHIGTLVLLEA